MRNVQSIGFSGTLFLETKPSSGRWRDAFGGSLTVAANTTGAAGATTGAAAAGSWQTSTNSMTT